jgi:hypothetical protein
MPTRARSFGRLVLGSLTLMPSTMMSPLWNGSSALTHLISVDFPEPDGPQTTTTSPLATLVVQSFSAWNDQAEIEFVGHIDLLFAADVTGNPNASFYPAHQHHDSHVEEAVQQRYRDKRFIRTGRVID